MPATSFDVIVIGAGPGGYVAALRAAQLGLSVAVVERESLGGVCLNWGCIPTKALLRSADIFRMMGRAEEFGLSAADTGFDLAAIIARSRKVAGQMESGVKHLLKKNKITTFMGAAHLPAPGQVSVTGKDGKTDLRAPNIILATGARARDIPGIEADGELVWNYRHALNPPRMPQKLLVVGAGAIGIEFASFYNAFGAEVTVVEAQDSILPVEDADISAMARKSFEKLGIRIMESAKLEDFSADNGRARVKITQGGDTQSHEFDTVISAIGITGNVEDLGLEELGITVERAHIVTDDLCRTGVDGIYAIGDVAGGPWLAHKASHEGVMVAELIAGEAVEPIARDAIAACTFCHPQIASIGLTEAAAQAKGHDLRIGKFPFVGNGKAVAAGEAEGMIKTIFDAKTGELLGAHMIGEGVSELIHSAAIGRTLETTEQEIISTVFPHPTLSEALHESVLSAYGRALHI